MSDENLYSIIDFGSSKIRLGIFGDYLMNSKYFKEYNIENKDVHRDDVELGKIIEKIILEAENEIDRHLINVNVMVDTPDKLLFDL